MAACPPCARRMGEGGRGRPAYHNFHTGEGAFERAIGIPSDLLASYRRIHSRSNVWLADENRFPEERTVVRGSDIVGDGDIKSSVFYLDWLRPTGLFNHLFVVVERQNGNSSDSWFLLVVTANLISRMTS